MKKGDLAFFYHTGDEKQIVGIAEVIKRVLSGSDRREGRFVAVDVKAVTPLPKPVTLAAIKAEPQLKDMALVKYARLSVQPVTDARMEARLQDGRAEGVTPTAGRNHEHSRA